MTSNVIACAIAALIVCGSAAVTTTATAGDVQGDAYDCQELWVMRNQIFKDNGYCFASGKARSYFGNGGCRYHNEEAVPLSRQERSTVIQIRASERRQGCR